MCGMQKIHRKTCKNCYSIPVPTTIEYGNFRNHSSLNFTFLMNVLLAIFHYISNVKKLYIFAVQFAVLDLKYHISLIRDSFFVDFKPQAFAKKFQYRPRKKERTLATKQGDGWWLLLSKSLNISRAGKYFYEI